MSKLQILVVIGSTRQGRFGDQPAKWIHDKLAADDRFASELVDLRDWPLPLFDQPKAPARIHDGNYGNEVANRWAAKVKAADGFIATVAEYNYGYTAVLKNALDWIYAEWVRKPIGFVGYGNAGGARAIMQLRQVVVELQMASIKSVHLPREVLMPWFKTQAQLDAAAFAPADASAKSMIDDLAWWAAALKAARG